MGIQVWENPEPCIRLGWPVPGDSGDEAVEAGAALKPRQGGLLSCAAKATQQTVVRTQSMLRFLYDHNSCPSNDVQPAPLRNDDLAVLACSMRGFGVSGLLGGPGDLVSRLEV